MAYCNKCGAYIPDGQTKCLACGFDEAAPAENKTASFSAAAAAAAQSFSEEIRKTVAEEKRRRQQEEDRKWAEEEHRRRMEQQRQRQEQKQQWQQDFQERYHGSYEIPKSRPAKKSSRDANRVLAALSYLSGLCFLPFFFCRDDEFAKYHAKQGLRLFVFSIVADIFSGVPFLGAAATLFRLYCIYKGMTNASNGKEEPLPYIGTMGSF